MADAKQKAAIPVPDNLSEGESPENLVAKFQTLSAEGDLLAQKRAYVEAISIFTQALSIRPTDKHCLVARSKCYIQIGSATLALADANSCLSDDPHFFKGLFQKAEALYAIGDFELALLYYHRGNRLRPELDAFRTGIQKSREAIENCVGRDGKPQGFRLAIAPRLRRNLGALFQTVDSSVVAAAAPVPVVGATPAPPTLETRLTPRVESKLLGELYEDKVYLQDLLSDRDFVDHPDEEILELVHGGLRYLDTRVDFWRQQYPLYARKKGKKIVPRMKRGGRKEGGGLVATNSVKLQMTSLPPLERKSAPPPLLDNQATSKQVSVRV